MQRTFGMHLLLVVFGMFCFVPAAHLRAEDQPITPTEVIKLFDGTDLSNFTTWLKATKHEDPNQVFSMQDGLIRISGEGAGYLATKQAYQNYHLVLEYKWGDKTDGSKYVRNSGVLIHGNGVHGGAGGVWMSSIECQLAQGCEGDFILIGGKDEDGNRIASTISSEIKLGEDKRPRWFPGGTKTKYSGRQFWWKNHQPFFKELRDTRGKDDVASPLGEWTKVECICDGDQVTVKINGVTVNLCVDVSPNSGKILLQNESNEVFFRNVELRPLKDKSK